MKDNTKKLKIFLLGVMTAILLVFFGIMIGKYISPQGKLHSEYKEKDSSTENVKKEIYHCPMHPHIISDHPGTCPICHMDLQKVEQDEDDSSKEENTNNQSKIQSKGKILFYRHPMRADITSKQPAKDEMGMDYIPVYEEEVENNGAKNIQGRAAFSLTQERQQLIGVTSTEVKYQELSFEIRSSGRVAFDPELYSGIEEYRQALISRREMKNSSYSNLRGQSEELVQSAKTKLRLMGLSDEQIKNLSTSNQKSLDLLLPNGAVWVYAEVFEYEVSGIKVGAKLEAEAPSIPGKIFYGKITSISPVVNSPTRTVRLRAIVPDPEKLLRPDTFLNVKVKMDLGKKLTIPEDSVLHSGDKTYVFVLKGKGKFEPRMVKTGVMAQDHYEILSGLVEGEKVVTAANFLIDSESKLRGVLQSSQENSKNEEVQRNQH